MILWWVAIISLGVSVAIYYALENQANFDADMNQRRLFLPLIGVIIAGVCLIAGTSHRWFGK